MGTSRARAKEEERCPKCGCPELLTYARQVPGGGLRTITSCPSCSYVVPAEAQAPPPAEEEDIWRGVTFRVRQVHEGCTEWCSDDVQNYRPTWKAMQYRPGDVWYARLRLGVHRFDGEGPNWRLALDECRAKALELMQKLRKALPK